MVNFEEFARRIASFTVGENFGSDSENGDSILLGYRLVTSQFVAIVEKTSLGRAVLRSLVKNTHSKVYKHPYYDLLDTDRSIGENACFFDSVKTWCKGNPENLKEVLIGEYGDRKTSDYEESVKLYFTLTPEPHFTALVGVKEKLHTFIILYFLIKFFEMAKNQM